MSKAALTIASKNYGSWSLRGWLLCKMAGLDFEEKHVVDRRSVDARRTFAAVAVVPGAGLHHDGAQGLGHAGDRRISARTQSGAGLLPKDQAQRAHCRSISGEMHSGFANLRSALPMNLKAHFPGFKSGPARAADIDRITTIWRDCLTDYGGPFLFGKAPCAADAMYAPVCTRFTTYDVAARPSRRPIAAPSWRCR